jgi:Cu+-exporting ATPase
MEVQLHVENMTCHNCSKTLRNALEPAEGVTGVIIKKPQKDIFVEFSPERISLRQILEIIAQKGYKAEIMHAKKLPEPL